MFSHEDPVKLENILENEEEIQNVWNDNVDNSHIHASVYDG